MNVAANRNVFGTSCARCRSHVVAPIRSNYMHDRIVSHEWYCECCDLTFSTSTRFNAEGFIHLREACTEDEKAAA